MIGFATICLSTSTQGIQALHQRGQRFTVSLLFGSSPNADESRQGLLAAYVDLCIAFDSVNRDALWRIFGLHGVPPKLILAMPCLPASALTPCLLPFFLHLPLCPSITMCARISTCCKDCPAGSYTTGTELSSPCTVFLHLPFSSICVFASSIQFTSRSQGLHWAAGYFPVLAQGSQRLHLGSLATPLQMSCGMAYGMPG